MKVAIITGATRGIGLGISKKLLEDGYHIAAMGTRDLDTYEDFKKIYEKGKVLYFKGDVSKEEDRIKFVNKTMEEYGHINVLINNAGVAPKDRLDVLDLTEESVDRLFNINTKGNLFMTQLVAKKMIEKKIDNQCIINISSISSEVVSTNRADYCVSKASISILTKIFAQRLANEGINVYEIQPGIIKTDMTKKVTSKYDKVIEKDVPLRRWGNPEDIANAVSALCEFKFIYTTGQVIKVDGGYTIQTL